MLLQTLRSNCIRFVRHYVQAVYASSDTPCKLYTLLKTLCANCILIFRHSVQTVYAFSDTPCKLSMLLRTLRANCLSFLRHSVQTVYASSDTPCNFYTLCGLTCFRRGRTQAWCQAGRLGGIQPTSPLRWPSLVSRMRSRMLGWSHPHPLHPLRLFLTLCANCICFLRHSVLIVCAFSDTTCKLYTLLQTLRANCICFLRHSVQTVYASSDTPFKLSTLLQTLRAIFIRIFRHSVQTVYASL